MKTKLMPILFVLFALNLFPSSANANPRIAGDLKQACSTAVADPHDNSIQGNICVAYILGWVDGIQNTFVVLQNRVYVVEFVEHSTIGQDVRVFYKYVNAHPESESESSPVVLTKALLEAKVMILVPIESKNEVR